ncbi:sodium:solute symporter family transporter [Flavobacterium degerlachei]|jgi:SSS family transporter|uniref:Transporter, SSS family n=1 Tax=Flavobacterium degerlachei TaxID=229203 RepID=A0A1H2R5B2_9FLAO|nr:sodium/solute symporter [Flavobacterium degerlachei]SDW14054.1 transporter, SSS family [Flavobacterium degerlachei]
MNWIDYTVVIVYLIAFLGLGFVFKENKDAKDYFLGGKDMGWFPLSLSAMATQLSAISFISAPAFVGLAQGGGMKWLTFELAVPLAMIGIILIIVPPLYRANIVSIYEFVERRFSTSTRIVLSLVFQISRSLSTGVGVYTIAIILQSVLDISFHWTILLITIITIVYSYMGGMKAVVWGDAIQMVILFGGLLICIYYGWDVLKANPNFTGFDSERLQVIDIPNLGFDGGTYGLLPMVLGGLFLYLSYYGTDQTQAQRLISAKDENAAKKILLTNGLLRFPVVLTYCIMGLIVGALVHLTPDFMNEIASLTQKNYPEEFLKNGIKPDLMLPVFIMKYLPHGLIGILIVGILSAAMSSVSATIHSLGAVTVEDLFNRGKVKLSQAKYMKFSKISIVFWGVVCIASAYLFGNNGGTVIELINMISSQFYGPILATFIIAILVKRVNYIGMNVGIIGGVLINVAIKFFFDDIFWIWFNLTGFVITFVLALVFSALFKTEKNEDINIEFKVNRGDIFSKDIIILAVFFLIILAVSFSLPTLLAMVK